MEYKKHDREWIFGRCASCGKDGLVEIKTKYCPKCQKHADINGIVPVFSDIFKQWGFIK